MTEETSKNEMGNIVSGSKDLLSSSVHWPEGTEEKKAGEVLPGKEEQPGTAESETVPEQPSRGDQQQSSGNREDKESEDSKSTSSELQHDRSTESDGSGGERDKQQQQQQRKCSHLNCADCDILFWEFIKKQQEAWDNLTKGGHHHEDEDDLIMDEETRESYPIEEDDLTILDLFVLKPNAFKFKERNNKKKNKKKKWFRSKKNRKQNGKFQYIIL